MSKDKKNANLTNGEQHVKQTHQQQQQQQNNTIILSDGKVYEMLNLKEILQLFNCAISQEQAWAVLYQVLSEFKHLFETRPELIKLNQDDIDINLLNFQKDGSIAFVFKKKLPTSSQHATNIELDEQEKNCLENKILKSIAYLIFDALDYGNNYFNEPALQTSLSHLLLLISGHYREFSSNKPTEDDEGYEQEEEDSVNLEKAFEICKNNIADPEYHYKAVCRGLYAQAYELKAFLAKIEDSKIILQKSGEDQAKYCFELLDKTDWAKLWMQVISELRNGVKLRKVCEINERNIEYELTPFEILLDQIRAKRYHLKKVSLDNSIGPEIKKDARDIILEFIRSRPPLRKSSQRNLNNSKIIRQETLNPHEKLMASIRNYSTPLRKTPVIDRTRLNVTNHSMNQQDSQRKRPIKPNLTSSDDDDSDIDYEEFKKVSMKIQEENKKFDQENLNRILLNLSIEQRKKRIKGDDCLRSDLSPWGEPVENWRALVTEDILTDTFNKTDSRRTSLAGNLSRRHTMNISDMSSNLSSLNIFSSFRTNHYHNNPYSPNKNNNNNNHNANEQNTNLNNKKVSDNWNIAKSRLTSPIYLKSGPGYDDFGFVSSQELIKKLANSENCLKLTFEELCHIRNVLTKAELDYLLFDNQLYEDVSKGRICFSCRKTKFNLFKWGNKCRVCQQRVCKKCSRNAHLKNGKIVQVPLMSLCPAKCEENAKMHNSNNSVYSHTTNEDENRIEEKLSKNLFNQIDYKREPFESQIKDQSRNINQEENIQLLDICVDCYQMMSGLIMTDCYLELQSDNNNKHTNSTNSGHNTDEENQKEIFSSTSSTSVTNSPSTITMNSLSNINRIVISASNHSSNMQSPTANKIILSSHHSTPSIQNTPMICMETINSSNENEEISTIVVNEHSSSNSLFDSFRINSVDTSANNNHNSIDDQKMSRTNLKLDLQPIYTQQAH